MQMECMVLHGLPPGALTGANMMIVTDWGCPVNVGFYHVAWTYDYVRDVDILFTVCGRKITMGGLLGGFQ